MPANTLIAYYSMSGNTRRIANEIGRVTGADVEEIGDIEPRHGFSGMLRALFDATVRRTPPIRIARHNPADYDLLVLGGPVWAGRMASPVRTYAERYGTRAPHVAFFCTESSGDAEKAFEDLQALCRHAPEATLVVDAAHLPEVEHDVALSEFASRLSSTH